MKQQRPSKNAGTSQCFKQCMRGTGGGEVFGESAQLQDGAGCCWGICMGWQWGIIALLQQLSEAETNLEQLFFFF